MKNCVRWSCLVALAVLGFALPAAAGQPQNSYFYCYKNSDGSGGCYGSLPGARASSDSYAYAEFMDYSFNNSGVRSRYFYGYQFGVSYSCQLPGSASPALLQIWDEVMTGRGYFDIAWDGTGTCTTLEAIQSSTWYY